TTEYLVTRGDIRRDKSILQIAAADYRTALEGGHSVDDAGPRLIEVHFRIGGIDLAMETCNQLIAASPTFAWGYGERGRLRVQRGKRAEALADLERCFELNPKLREFRAARADLRESKELWKEAIEDYTEAIGAGSTSADLYASRGRCHRKIGETIPAFDDFAKAVQLNPNSGWVHTELADISVLRKEWDAALKSAAEALRINEGYV